MLTKRQQQICEFVRQYGTEHGRSPTLEEIRVYLGVSSLATVHKHLKALEERGAVRRLAGRARGLEVVAESEWMEQSEIELLPVIEDVRPPFPDGIDSLPKRIVPTWLLGSEWAEQRADKYAFLFQQKNNSMEAAGIATGDWIVCLGGGDFELTDSPRLMVVSVDNIGSIVRWVRRDGDKIRVSAGLQAIRPFSLDPGRITVYAEAVCLLRAFSGLGRFGVEEG